MLWLFLGLGIFLYAGKLTLNGSVGSMQISQATAGEEPDGMSDHGTSYDIKIDKKKTGKIVGKLSDSLPTGASIMVSLSAPTGATSLGNVSLTTTDQELVINIPEKTKEDGLPIMYTLDVTVEAGVLTSQSVNVQYTLIEE